jgi:hypothetical protein
MTVGLPVISVLVLDKVEVGVVRKASPRKVKAPKYRSLSDRSAKARHV